MVNGIATAPAACWMTASRVQAPATDSSRSLARQVPSAAGRRARQDEPTDGSKGSESSDAPC